MLIYFYRIISGGGMTGRSCFLAFDYPSLPSCRTPKPSKPGKPVAVPMLWGVGTTDSTDATRLAQFRKITIPPPFVLAYEEPDCPPGEGSAGVSVLAGVSHWESLIVPLGKMGTLLGSPSMCSAFFNSFHS